MKTRIVVNFSLMVWLLTACSVEITDVTPVSQQDLLVTPTPLAIWTPAPQPIGPISPIATPTSAKPLPWANLHLTGQLVFLNFGQTGQTLVKLDLVSGALTTIFQPPKGARLGEAAVSPDGTQIVMTYAPPPATGQTQSGYGGLYLMPTDGSNTPRPLLEKEEESFSTPVWSPDGQYIYYSHFFNGAGYNTLNYTVERVIYPDGQPEVLLENAFWPSLSPDGSKLAYLSFDPDTYTEMLKLADAAGTNPKLVMPADAFPIIDAHFFSPDGSRIIFSTPNKSAGVKPSWLEQLLGIQIASAHGLPSDWWRVSVRGGQSERLTQISGSGLYGDFALDGKHIAFIDLNGVYIMNSDGTQILQLLTTMAYGMLQWQP